MKITVSSPVNETARVAQLRGMFDLPDSKSSTLSWEAKLPLNDKPWNIGLIVGPSGCGKSTIARHIWPPSEEDYQAAWRADASIIDAFPESLGIKDVVEILSSVGFSSPPAWLRPFHVLSTGQQFRVTLARLIATAGHGRPIVFDEYTSVVDRTVAQICSAALEKTIRRRRLQFVAVTCHEDVEAWLNPDWVYRPAEQDFAWRSLCPRPRIKLDIVRCHASAWQLFAPHHYLSDKLNTSSTCFLAVQQHRPVAFSAWLPFFGGGPPRRREHRTVTLPDFQGIGIGNRLSATIASMWKALDYGATSTTTHPAMIQARLRSKDWRMTRSPSLAGAGDVVKHASGRLTAGFEYVGPAMPRIVAKALLG